MSNAVTEHVTGHVTGHVTHYVIGAITNTRSSTAINRTLPIPFHSFPFLICISPSTPSLRNVTRDFRHVDGKSDD